jgi:hypothetical protein
MSNQITVKIGDAPPINFLNLCSDDLIKLAVTNIKNTPIPMEATKHIIALVCTLAGLKQQSKVKI